MLLYYSPWIGLKWGPGKCYWITYKMIFEARLQLTFFLTHWWISWNVCVSTFYGWIYITQCYNKKLSVFVLEEKVNLAMPWLMPLRWGFFCNLKCTWMQKYSTYGDCLRKWNLFRASREHIIFHIWNKLSTITFQYWQVRGRMPRRFFWQFYYFHYHSTSRTLNTRIFLE